MEKKSLKERIKEHGKLIDVLKQAKEDALNIESKVLKKENEKLKYKEIDEVFKLDENSLNTSENES